MTTSDSLVREMIASVWTLSRQHALEDVARMIGQYKLHEASTPAANAVCDDLLDDIRRLGRAEQEASKEVSHE